MSVERVVSPPRAHSDCCRHADVSKQVQCVPGGKIGNELSLERQLNARNLSGTWHDFSQNSTDLEPW